MKPFALLGLLASVLTHSAHHRVLEGEAAWYGREHRGKLMANGEKFDEYKLTCATWFYPLGTELRVTNVKTGASVRVVVSDRGPSWRLVYSKRRIIDLSYAAFAKIHPTYHGVVQVKVETVEKVVDGYGGMLTSSP